MRTTTGRIIATVLMVAFFIVTIVSCGSVTNNDQGTSFLATGFFRDGDATVGDAGQIVTLFTDTENSTLGGDGQTVLTFISLQNRLSSQFIRVIRIDCSYIIQGSQVSIPDDSNAVSLVLGPDSTTVADETSSSSSSSGGTSSALANINRVQFEIVSPDIMAFINNNRALLPELPFRMTATCSATGVTQAGDTITTNEINYFIQFVDKAECCTGQGINGGGGFEIGTGTGGDLISTEGNVGDNQDSGAVLIDESTSTATN